MGLTRPYAPAKQSCRYGEQPGDSFSYVHIPAWTHKRRETVYKLGQTRRVSTLATLPNVHTDLSGEGKTFLGLCV